MATFVTGNVYDTRKVKTFNKSILIIIGLVVLVHSVSHYAIQANAKTETVSVELTEEAENQDYQLESYEALLPTVQAAAPLVLYLIHEVTLLSEVKFHEVSIQENFTNRYLEHLFPVIISPNAP